MTMPQAALEIYSQGMPYLAALVAGFIVIIPVIVSVTSMFVCGALLLRRSTPLLRSMARLLFTLQSLSMADVFLVGVIVSLVKIMKMATVVIGISFWAYAAFGICFTIALYSLDRYQCWHFIDQVDA